MTPQTTPTRLDLKRDEKLEIDWQDGRKCVYSLSLLRSMPCAKCRELREADQKRKSALRVLPGNYSGAITVLNAEMVGNYAIKLHWSDDHDTGIYSFEYLREICPETK